MKNWCDWRKDGVCDKALTQSGLVRLPKCWAVMPSKKMKRNKRKSLQSTKKGYFDLKDWNTDTNILLIGLVICVCLLSFYASISSTSLFSLQQEDVVTDIYMESDVINSGKSCRIQSGAFIDDIDGEYIQFDGCRLVPTTDDPGSFLIHLLLRFCLFCVIKQIKKCIIKRLSWWVAKKRTLMILWPNYRAMMLSFIRPLTAWKRKKSLIFSALLSNDMLFLNATK